MGNSSNKDEAAEAEEEEFNATQASTEDKSPINKYKEGNEYDQEDDQEDTVLSDTKNTEEEASSRQEGKSLLSDLSLRSDNNNEYDDGNGAEDNTCYVESNGNGNEDGRGDMNMGVGGGFA